MEQVNPQDLPCFFLPGKGRGMSTLTAVGEILERAGNQGYGKSFVLSHKCSPVVFHDQVLPMELCPVAIAGAGM